ncbi:MAG: PAS domain-containing protein [Anaerovoracaceae bacterium]
MDYEFDINNTKDVMIVDAKGRLQYFNIGSMEFFDLKPEEILGKTMPELYENLDADTSTFEIAVHKKRETLQAVQVLRTQGGKSVQQTSDTLLIRDGETVLGAVEFTYNYDEEKEC